jgi:hypothetical protein
MTCLIHLGTFAVLLALGIMWFCAHRIGCNRGLFADSEDDQ